MELKFKVGDRVTMINNDNYKGTEVIGKCGIILYTVEHQNGFAIHGKFDDGTGLHTWSDNLVLEEIYNSSLYKIMQEIK